MRQRGLRWILKGFSHKEASCFYFATHSAFSSPLSGALGLPRPLSAPTQQVPQAGNWVQEWGQLGCHMMAKPAEGSPRWRTGGLPQAVGCACACAYACSAGRSLGSLRVCPQLRALRCPGGVLLTGKLTPRQIERGQKRKETFSVLTPSTALFATEPCTFILCWAALNYGGALLGSSDSKGKGSLTF